MLPIWLLAADPDAEAVFLKDAPGRRKDLVTAFQWQNQQLAKLRCPDFDGLPYPAAPLKDAWKGQQKRNAATKDAWKSGNVVAIGCFNCKTMKWWNICRTSFTLVPCESYDNDFCLPTTWPVVLIDASSKLLIPLLQTAPFQKDHGSGFWMTSCLTFWWKKQELQEATAPGEASLGSPPNCLWAMGRSAWVPHPGFTNIGEVCLSAMKTLIRNNLWTITESSRKTAKACALLFFLLWSLQIPSGCKNHNRRSVKTWTMNDGPFKPFFGFRECFCTQSLH